MSDELPTKCLQCAKSAAPIIHATCAYSSEVGHLIQAIPASQSSAKRPPSPGDVGHPVGAKRRRSVHGYSESGVSVNEDFRFLIDSPFRLIL